MVGTTRAEFVAEVQEVAVLRDAAGVPVTGLLALRLAARLHRVVHRGEELIRCVQMGAVMGRDLHLFHGRVFAIRELIDPDTHIFGHCGCGLVVIQILDLR